MVSAVRFAAISYTKRPSIEGRHGYPALTPSQRLRFGESAGSTEKPSFWRRHLSRQGGRKAAWKAAEIGAGTLGGAGGSIGGAVIGTMILPGLGTLIGGLIGGAVGGGLAAGGVNAAHQYIEKDKVDLREVEKSVASNIVSGAIGGGSGVAIEAGVNAGLQALGGVPVPPSVAHAAHSKAGRMAANAGSNALQNVIAKQAIAAGNAIAESAYAKESARLARLAARATRKAARGGIWHPLKRLSPFGKKPEPKKPAGHSS